MSEWHTSAIGCGDGAVQVCPYYEWALATGFAYYGDATWTPLLIELEGASAEQFANRVTELQRTQPRGWAQHLKVPDFFASPPKRLKSGLAVLCGVAAAPFFAELRSAKNSVPNVRRFEIGRAVPPALGQSKPPPQPPPPAASEIAPVVVTGVIDDGIAFANQRFCSGDGTTRIEFFWDQRLPVPFWGVWGYGREIDKRNPGTGIDVRMAQSRHAGVVDEDEVYRRTGHFDMRSPGHQPLAASATHGTHVMDLACCDAAPPAAATRPIVAVQLPTATVADTSGALLGPQVFNGLCYTLDRAEKIAALFGATQPLPVVVNISYGTIAGAHDGSALLERAIDGLVAACAGTLQVVLPAGNNHLSRCHAAFGLAHGQTETLRWRVMPDDWTESLLEIRLPDCSHALELSLTTPDGVPTGAFGWGVEQFLVSNGKVVAMASYYPPGVADVRALICIRLAPTAEPAGKLPTVAAGVWTITLHNPGAALAGIHAWIQRDDTAPGYSRRGRQSFFDDAAYARFDAGGREIDDDAHPLTAASVVRRCGTINAIATGHRTVVVGGYRQDDRKPAGYSASGPAVPPGRDPIASADPDPDGPDAMLPSDDSPSHRGLLASGTRSGSCFAMHGTSVAAPLATRWLAEQFAAGKAANRKALFDAAMADDPPAPGKPPAQRGGGGRLKVRSPRPR